MSYKTILVHLNQEPRARALVAAGIELAAKFEAHLIGLYVFPAFRVTPPIPLPIGGDLAGQIKGAIKREADLVKAVFDEMTRHQPFVSEWRAITDDRREPSAVVVSHALAADIVVASQRDPAWQFSDILDFPDRLALGAGRPVLVIPNFGTHKVIPRNVTVAWTNRRESARAVADALPLLKLADNVHLLTAADGRPDDGGALPDTEIAAALARHGVKVQASRPNVTEYTVGEEIRVRAIDLNADLLVMGCYGHSRLREYALGGVTRHMMREMTIPILFSH